MPSNLPERQSRKAKSFNHFYLPIEPERENLQNWKKPGNKISNGELSRAAAALLVKSVRVGVGLGDLLSLLFNHSWE